MLDIQLQRSHSVLVIDSRIIAHKLEIPHEDFTYTIKKFKFIIQKVFGLIEVRSIRSRKVFPDRHSEKYYLLNEGQAIFYTTLTNSAIDTDRLNIELSNTFSQAKNNLNN